MRHVIATILLVTAAALAVAATAGGTVATTASTHHLSEFQSPSHNIGCGLFSDEARCDINHRTYRLPSAPRSCHLNFGQGLFVATSGRGAVVCAGDTQMNPEDHVLAYGSTDTVGRFACTSATTGVTCTNTHNGHGFFISIQSYRLF
jgi:hypothetical protein